MTMATAESMNISPKRSKENEGMGHEEIKVKTTSNNGRMGSEEALQSNLSLLPNGSSMQKTGEPGTPDAGISSGNRLPSEILKTGDEMMDLSAVTEDTPDTSSHLGSLGPAQNEIVVATHCRTTTEAGAIPSDSVSEARFEPIKPAKPCDSREGTQKAHDVPTSRIKLKVNVKDEEATIPTARRNPKRTASSMIQPHAMAESKSDEILEETLKPLEEGELENWPGWIELESEPVRPRMFVWETLANGSISGILQLYSQRLRGRGRCDKRSTLPGG